jgi:WD40 repeat protein
LLATYDPILAGIVRILNAHDQVVGTGFLISHSPERRYGLIATSTRVIEQATSLPIEEALSETVHLIFQLDPSNALWNGSILSWSSSSREDVSILQIEGTLPKQTRTLPLSLATASEGRRVSIFGYPANSNDFLGAWRYCDICRPGPKHVKTELAFLQLDSPLITVGYSGAPVWDDERRKVSGTHCFSLPHKGSVWAVAFNSDGKYLATGSSDSTSGIWETATGHQIAHLPHKADVHTVSFSPEGKYLVTGSMDGYARVWLWQPEDLMREAITRVTHTLTKEEWQQFVGDGSSPIIYT